jgi:cellulose synthase/poly-beta-1,6-N-acetylglucosamine synthase-like glycosyltransferase
MRLLLVPAAEPRTKPKACNYGMVFATGTFLTIYDAEDEPEPLQLRRAVALFARHPELACIQAKLAFHNSSQNLLTGWFAAEYGLWFGYLLPGLAKTGSPVPLGGTSNHIRADVLRAVGGWDPFNVTEDADLGVRLARRGHRTGVLDSTTFEEANSDAINWIRQRSRWYKGYLQSWLVAMRTPRATVRTLGVRGTVAMTLLLAGTPIAASVNLAFWLVSTIWILGQPDVIAQAFPGYVYYSALVSFLVGNVLVLYSNLLGARASREHGLLLACLLNPLYWVLMAIGAVKGIWQLMMRPSYWEKTVHGLDQSEDL